MKVCGLDEAGRGPLAGPLVGAAVVLKERVPGLNDSKLLNKKQREELYKQIIESGAITETEVITCRSINTKGMAWAGKEVFRRLIKKIEADEYVVDGKVHPGTIKFKTEKIRTLIDADAVVECVMAASIVAKVIHDGIMAELDRDFPQYEWKRNMGYGTKRHIGLIKEFGPSKHHRSVFVTTATRNLYGESL